MNGWLDRLDFGFFEPVWLAVGAVACVAVLLLELGSGRRRRQAMRLFAAEHLLPGLTASISQGKRLLKRALLLTAVALVFVALSRPHMFYQWREENRIGLDVLLAVDCSRSMLSEDVKPNRIEHAKLAVEDFAERMSDNRLGLIAFAGDSFLECPLTQDRQAFLESVRDLDTETIPRPGTDIASAIDEAVQALKSQPDNMKLLILITDGEDLENRAIDSAKTAAKAGLKIYTVGVGTPAGGAVPLRDDTGGVTFLRDGDDQTVHSRLDETTLRQIAALTGGAYVPLGQHGEGLQAIYDRYIAALPKQQFEQRREKIRLEQYEWPLGLAILFLAWEFLVRERAAQQVYAPVPELRRRPRREPNAAAVARLVLFALLGLGTVNSARAAAPSAEAERAYKDGHFADSAQHYGEAAAVQPNRRDLQYDQGDAAFRAGEYDEAEQAFRKALETPNLNLQENSYYNLGNTQYRHGEATQKVDPKETMKLWQQALGSYTSALKLRDAADTRHNYDVVKRKLEQLQQQQQKQQQQQQQTSSQNDDKNQQQQQQQNSQGQGQSQNNPQQNQGNPQNNSQNNGSDQPQQQPQPQQGNPNQQGQSGEEKSAQNQPGNKGTQQQQARSSGREQDKQDPNIRSRDEAEALLDSLKDDEHRITAQSLNGNNQPPPTASGKDW